MELKPDKLRPKFAFSRMNNTSVYYDPETKLPFYGMWEVPKFDNTDRDIVIKIPTRYAFRPDVLSYMFYNTPFLDWAICLYNDIIDPFDPDEGLYAERLIKIPPTKLVLSKLT